MPNAGLAASLTARTLHEPVWSAAVNLRAINLLWPMGQPATSRKVIDDALADISGSDSHPLLACRALQLAVEARPGDVLRICESIDRGQLVALPALILAWAQIIALGELGHPLKAAAISEEAVRLAAASPEAALQSALLVVYQTEALILGGYLADALAVAARTFEQAADVPGVAQSFAAAVSGVAALGNGELHTAVACLRRAVNEFPNRTDGGLYHFGIFYARGARPCWRRRCSRASACPDAAQSPSRPPPYGICKPAGRRMGGSSARTHFASTGPGSGGG